MTCAPTDTFKLHQVCPPGLHITLGIFYRLWCLLEAECHELDLELPICTSPTPADRESFQKYSTHAKKLAHLKEKRGELMKLTTSLNSALGDLAIQIPNAESHPLVLAMKEVARTAALLLDEVVINTHCLCTVHM